MPASTAPCPYCHAANLVVQTEEKDGWLMESLHCPNCGWLCYDGSELAFAPVTPTGYPWNDDDCGVLTGDPIPAQLTFPRSALDENGPVTLHRSYYPHGGAPALYLRDYRGEPLLVLTVNLPERNSLLVNDRYFLAKTWSENKRGAAVLLASGLFEDTGIRVPNAFVQAELWRWAERLPLAPGVPLGSAPPLPPRTAPTRTPHLERLEPCECACALGPILDEGPEPVCARCGGVVAAGQPSHL